MPDLSAGPTLNDIFAPDQTEPAPILIVDDEDGVLGALRRLLRREGYQIFCASGGEEGLTVLERQPVQLVISDQRMPNMEGTVFLQKVKERWPHTVRVILSGYADPALVVESVNKGEVYRFFPKPWDDEELKVGIRQCLAHYQLQEENRRLLERVREQNEQLRRMNAELEEMVAARTLSLQLAQEIVERLPVGVFGISVDDEMLLCNEVGRRMLTEEFGRAYMPGSLAEELLPPELLGLVADLRQEGGAHLREPFEVAGKPYHIFCCPLGVQGVRGTLLILNDLPFRMNGVPGQ